jgi:hypothetical protein
VRSASISLVLLSTVVVACSRTSSEPATKTSSFAETIDQAEPTSIPNALGFGPIIGETLPLSVPTPDSYRGSGEFGQRKFITRERTVSNAVESRTVIELLEGGKMTACFAGNKDEHTSVSRYESRDGEDHEYDHDERWLLGATGSWSIVDGRARVLLTEVRQGTCTPDIPQTGFELPFELTCVLLGPGENVPVRIMACRLDKEPGWLSPAGLDLGKSSNVGPWSFRFTTGGPTDNQEPNGPWLLLASGDGIHVKSTDERRDPGPTLTLTRGAHELVEDDWKHKRPKDR